MREAAHNASSIVARIAEDWLKTERATTFSDGVAVHREAHTATSALDRADAAMYEAKRQGRDGTLQDQAATR